MDRHETTKAAIIDLLRSKQLAVGKPLDLYEVGVPLIGDGFTQNELLYALEALQREQVIRLLPTNALELVKAL